MSKIVVVIALGCLILTATPGAAWWNPPVVVPFDSVVAPAPIGLPPLLCAPIHQGPWDGVRIWSPGPFVDGYGFMPHPHLPPPLMAP
ncbi:hypothetical protein [Desulfomonile tiedjei]|uniref:Uncharacterized protein n=1 Tax=Desulfomonile tiedjei (strain ATCC 49306 / DSM 6799 / DCB-1) TaxID=706587 RepID=I4C6K1_DESTA|nr:hypothetical protein [Desulfomonile tiedjei]AFM25192.1 hypothetical protein Desti_2512 [Desulfomonile tiedjei DSM 6799]